MNDSAAAFALLFNEHRAQIERIAFGVTQDFEEAKDIAQDTYLRAYRSRDRLESGRDYRSWLFVIARRCAIDSLRRSRRRSTLVEQHELPGLAASPEELVLKHDEALLLRGLIAGLCEPYRNALYLYYMHGLHYREIAAELHIPLGTVKTLIYRAKQELRMDLERAHRRAR